MRPSLSFMSKTALAALTLGLGLQAPAQALDGPAGQVFRATATGQSALGRPGDVATIRFEAGGGITVSGIKDAMGEDPFTSEVYTYNNGEIRVDLDFLWADPEAAGEDVPTCWSWPDYPLDTPIEAVGGDWGSEGTCWTGGDVSNRWDIRRIE